MSGALLSRSAPPPCWPDDHAPEEQPVRRWRVLHACDDAGPAASVAEAEIQAGMWPSLMTPEGWYRPGGPAREAPTALSLIHEWQAVRRWRNLLVAEAADTWADVLHAHCFAAAMAGLRGSSPVVYELLGPIGAAVTPKPGAWLLHSLRLAEQFVLSRADVVVVHSHAMWTDALKRGVPAADLFLVPEPVDLAEWAAPPSRAGITLFAPDVFAGGEADRDASLHVVLPAFAMLAGEINNVHLIVEAGPQAAARVAVEARKLDLSACVKTTAPAERPRAMAAAHIVIAGHSPGGGPSRTVKSAFAHGRALLAADVPQNREVTPLGRGCLWYRAGDARDLAGRAAFLARNRDFRVALAGSGRHHLHATCGPLAVARKYDEVYRCAFQARRRGPIDPLRKLEVAQAHW